MSRISIDVTEHQRKRLKAPATLEGVSLKNQKETLAELKNFLDERLRKASAGKICRRKVGEILKQAYREPYGRANS